MRARQIDWRPLRDLLLVLALTTTLAGISHARRIVSYNSDLAVVALMAQDILYRGAHPVFFDGSEYAGTLEQHLVAAFFAILPDVPAVHELAIIFELAIGISLVWACTRQAFGAKAALASGLYLALGPSFFYYRGLASAGPYTPLFALGAGILFAIFRIEGRALAEEPIRSGLAALGLLIGLAWWTHPLGAALGACAIVGLLVGAARRKLTLPSVALAVTAFFAGSLPWWHRNLETGWASLGGADAAVLSWRDAAARLDEFFTIGVPVLMGARPAWSPAEAFPGAGALSMLVLAVLVGFAVWLVLHGGPAARHAALVLLALLVICVSLALFSHRTLFLEPRAFYSFYLSIAPIFGVWLTWPKAGRGLRGSLLGAVAILHLAGHVTAPRVAPFPRRVIERLEQHEIQAVYTSYWTSYLLTFLAKGHIVATPFGTGTVVRRAQDRAFVDASPAPAFLFDQVEPVRLEAPAHFEAFLRSRKYSYHREEIDGLTLFTDVAPEAVAIVRGCFCIPSGLGPEAVVWQGVSGPDRIVRGGSAVYRVRLRNGGRLSWSLNTNVAYHWLRLDGTYAVFDGRRTRPATPPQPGESLAIDTTVEANVEPGEYTLVIDAVEEGVAWFETLGAPPLRLQVRVEPPVKR